jgi:hypothetical protein
MSAKLMKIDYQNKLYSSWNIKIKFCLYDQYL